MSTIVLHEWDKWFCFPEVGKRYLSPRFLDGREYYEWFPLGDASCQPPQQTPGRETQRIMIQRLLLSRLFVCVVGIMGAR